MNTMKLSDSQKKTLDNLFWCVMIVLYSTLSFYAGTELPNKVTQVEAVERGHGYIYNGYFHWNEKNDEQPQRHAQIHVGQ